MDHRKCQIYKKLINLNTLLGVYILSYFVGRGYMVDYTKETSFTLSFRCVDVL